MSGQNAKSDAEAVAGPDRRAPFSVIPETAFGKYTLIGKLGQGGMAEVYLAYSAGPAGFRKLLVIKRLHKHLEDEPGFLDMFLDEARLAARLNHQNVVQTYEVGKAEGSHFIAMEYLEGQSLDQIMKRSAAFGAPLPPAFVARTIAEALEGLNYAHELSDFDGQPLGVVHRDVSPHNIFITYEGVVKVVDFGIAKAATHVVHTGTGIVKGKLAYMAPEQAEGEDVDRRVDLWSIGVVLWEALVGRRLFKGGNDLATWRQTLMGDIPPVKDIAPKTPDLLARITHKALQRDPGNRYHSAGDMKSDLEEFLASGGKEGSKSYGARHISELFADVIEQYRQVLRAYLGDATAEMGLLSGEFLSTEKGFKDKGAADVPDGSTELTGPPEAVLETDTDPLAAGVTASFVGPGVAAGISTTPAPIAVAPPVEQRKKHRSWLPGVVVVLLFVVFASLIWWWRGGPGADNAGAAAPPVPSAPEPPAPTAPRETLVSFTSSPESAEVLLGSRVLGRTPLERRLDPTVHGSATAFTFRLEGHEETTIRATVRGERATVHATLAETRPPPPDAGATEERPRPGGRRGGRPGPRRPRGGPAVEPASGGTDDSSPGGGAPPAVEDTTPAGGGTGPAVPVVVEDPPPAPRPPRGRPDLVVDDDPRAGVPVVD